LKAVYIDIASLFLRIVDLFAYAKVEKDLVVFQEHWLHIHSSKPLYQGLHNSFMRGASRALNPHYLRYGSTRQVLRLSSSLQDCQAYQHCTPAVEEAQGCYEKVPWAG